MLKNTSSPYRNQQGRTTTRVSCGVGMHVCAILDNGKAKCWGANMLGQLGIGDSAARGDNPNEMMNALPEINMGTVSIHVLNVHCPVQSIW
jgi:hypothetical protein